ncbi:MAG: RsmE family RNA methyltransferase [Candidatus Paceibacterota bacterium]
MRLHRFYIDKQIEGETVDITDKDLVHQWKNVFRYNVGSQVVVFNGSGYDYLAFISSLRNLGATLTIVSKKKTPKISRCVGLAISLLKKENIELVIQKATELGVSFIQPIISERSEKKNLNIARAKKIALEASEQSGRGDVPMVNEPMNLKDFLDSSFLSDFQNVIALHPEGLLLDREVIDREGSFLIFVGPEGGFSEEEIKMFKDKKIEIFSLGSLVLRGETASVAVATLFLLGR